MATRKRGAGNNASTTNQHPAPALCEVIDINEGYAALNLPSASLRDHGKIADDVVEDQTTTPETDCGAEEEQPGNGETAVDLMVLADSANDLLSATFGPPDDGGRINAHFFAGAFKLLFMVTIYRGQVCFYEVTSGLWRVPFKAELIGLLLKFARNLCNQLALDDLKAGLKTNQIKEQISLLLAEGEPFNPPPRGAFIHTLNGMVDLATDMPKLLPFGPDYGSMSQIRICYQADAKCPKFEAWLAANMEADDVKTFQEWFGSLTLGSSATTKPALNSTTGMKTSLKLCCGALGVALLGAVIMAGADTPTAANN